MENIELNEVRKALKPIGFTITTKSLSFGLYGTIKHIESGKLNTGNCYSPESLLFWQPAFDILKQFKDKEFMLRNSKVFGLRDFCK